MKGNQCFSDFHGAKVAYLADLYGSALSEQKSLRSFKGISWDYYGEQPFFVA